MSVLKIKKKMLKDDFIPVVPRELPLDNKVLSNSVRIYVILQHFIYSGYEYPSLRDLTHKELKLSITTVSKCLDNLEDLGWIKREKTSVTGNIHYIMYVIPNRVEYNSEMSKDKSK